MSNWELDLFSTQLSRKHSFHKSCGNLRYVKMKPQRPKCLHEELFGTTYNYRCTCCGETFNYKWEAWK